ncbi:MAG: PH domain-containing protein [Thermoguttaceae bacterium]
MHCPKCGVDVVEEAVYCHECGQRIESAADIAIPAASSEDASPMEKFQAAVESRQAVQDEPERELWKGGYSTKAMIGAWVFSSAVTLAMIALVVWRWQAWVAYSALAIVVLLWLYQLAVMSYRKVNVRYKLTTLRFMHESGILRRVTDRIETIDMTDITFEQSLLERFVGVGTIHITSSDRSHPQLVMPGIENVKKISELIDEIRCNERRRRGLRIDQI